MPGYSTQVDQYASNNAYPAAAGVIMLVPALLPFLVSRRRFFVKIMVGALTT